MHVGISCLGDFSVGDSRRGDPERAGMHGKNLAAMQAIDTPGAIINPLPACVRVEREIAALGRFVGTSIQYLP
jgi:hypothetical protein